MKSILVLLMFATTSFAADKECQKICRTQFNDCKTKVNNWAENQYIEIEGSETYMRNREALAMYKMVDNQEKKMKKECKDQHKECLLSCE